MRFSFQTQIQAAVCSLGLISFAIAETAGAPQEGIRLPETTLSASYSVSGKTEQESGNSDRGSVGVDSYQLSLRQTVLPSFTVSLEHSQNKLDFGDDDSTGLPKRLRSYILGFGYNRNFSQSLTGIMMVSPGWRTTNTSSAFDKEGLGFSCGFMVRRQYSESFAYTLGVGYDSLARGTLKMLPMVGIEWSPAKKWAVSLGFPKTGVTFKASDSFNVSLVFEGEGGTYYMGKDETPQLEGRPDLSDTVLEFYDLRVGLSLAYSFSSSTSLRLNVGQVLSRRFDFHDRDYELKSNDSALYGSVGISLGF